MARAEAVDAARARGDRQALLAVAALAVAPAIGLGVARFAYALVLPAMRADLAWSYAAAGWMNGTNALGYLLGAALAARVIAAAGALRVTVAGVLACIVSLALCAVLRDTLLLNLARVLAGLGGGFSFVAGGVLASRIAGRDPERAGQLLGLFYAGPGLGIVVSGITVPFLLERLGPTSWDVAWGALALASVLLALGLLAARDTGGGARPGTSGSAVSYRSMGWLLGGYALFGAGYIAYMTFMIARVQGSGGGAGSQALFWVAIGGAAMATPWLWGGVLKRLAGGRAFALFTALTMIGAALPLLSARVPVLIASALLFGGTFFAVVASTTVFARRNLPAPAWPAGIAALTIAFGIGQVLGPVAIGIVNDSALGLSGGLWVSVGLLALGALAGARQSDLAPAEVGVADR